MMIRALRWLFEKAGFELRPDLNNEAEFGGEDDKYARGVATRRANEERKRREFAERQERERRAWEERERLERAACAAKGLCFTCRRPLNEHAPDGRCVPCARCGHTDKHLPHCDSTDERSSGLGEDCDCPSYVRGPK